MPSWLLCILLFLILLLVLFYLCYSHLNTVYHRQSWLPWPFLSHSSFSSSSSSSSSFLSPVSIGLIIAHPDDESMFFLPTLCHLLSYPDHIQVFLLCLSTGSSYSRDIGRQRLQELFSCLNSLGVITFDQEGVSGHPNHRSIYHALGMYLYEHPTFIAWSLQSVPIYFKYLSFLPTPLLLPPSLHRFSSSSSSASRTKQQQQQQQHQDTSYLLLCLFAPALNWRCMAYHVSQFVYYRRAFVVFSLYSYVNILHRMK